MIETAKELAKSDSSVLLAFAVVFLVFALVGIGRWGLQRFEKLSEQLRETTDKYENNLINIISDFKILSQVSHETISKCNQLLMELKERINKNENKN